jgi:signal transduction histidine kinase
VSRRLRAHLSRPARNALLTDGLLALFLVVPLIADSAAPLGATVTTAAVIAAGVAVSRPAPLLSLLVGAAIGLPYLAFGFDALRTWPLVAMVVLGFLAGRRSVDTRPAVTVFARVSAAGLVLALLMGEGWTWPLMLAAEAAVVLPWWFGRSRRLRTRLMDAGWERAERLEREKRMVAEQARLRERARIAQDMHDTLGHRLSLVALQAGGLEMNSRLDDDTRTVATQLRTNAVEATELLRDIVGVLSEMAEPAPGQDTRESITALVDRARGSGVRVVLHRDGEPIDLPPMVDRAAYRVVQESLTNAIKHAPGEEITVRLVYRPEQTTVTVTNRLPAAATAHRPGGAAAAAHRPGGGRGLIGLHERVRLAGGSLCAGPQDGRYTVAARLPTAGDQVDSPPADDVPGWPAPAAQTPGAETPGAETPAADTAAVETPLVELRRARRSMRRELRYAATVPLILLATLAAIFLGLRTYTTTTTALDRGDFARLRVNQTRAEIDHVLPPASMDRSLPTVPEPAVPPGARCEYYRTTANPFTLSNDLYRLCFRGGVLVAKDHLVEDPQ